MNIVIVDDDVSSGLLCKEAVLQSNRDCNVTVLTTGTALKEHLEQHTNLLTQADLILLDLNMQPLSGKEVLAELKADAAYRKIPIVILSGSAKNQDVIDCMNLHGNCYIIKDHDFDKFSERIRILIDFWRNVTTLPVKEVYTVKPLKKLKNDTAGDALENEKS